MNNGLDVTIDIPLSNTKVARIVEENGGVRVSSVSKLGEGLEFKSFLVNNRWVFRFPKHITEWLDPDAERSFSQRLNLPISVPQIEFIWEHPWGYPVTISGYEYLAGTALEQFRPEDLDQDCLATQLGTVLTEIHSMNGDDISNTHDQLETLRTCSEDLDEQLSSFDAGEITTSQRLAIKSYVDQYRFDLPLSETVVIHGDLGADHILLNDHAQLSGIIDWSNHTKGSRYRDFVGIWRWGGDRFCARVLSNYTHRPSRSELAFVRVMGLISCIAREILLRILVADRHLSRAPALLEQRVFEIANKGPYDALKFDQSH